MWAQPITPRSLRSEVAATAAPPLSKGMWAALIVVDGGELRRENTMGDPESGSTCGASFSPFPPSFHPTDPLQLHHSESDATGNPHPSEVQTPRVRNDTLGCIRTILQRGEPNACVGSDKFGCKSRKSANTSTTVFLGGRGGISLSNDCFSPVQGRRCSLNLGKC